MGLFEDKLGKQIIALVCKFEQETGLPVKEIRLRRKVEAGAEAPPELFIWLDWEDGIPTLSEWAEETDEDTLG